MFRICTTSSHRTCRLDTFKGSCMRLHRGVGRPKGKTELWSEKLQSDERYPLTIALNEAILPTVASPSKLPPKNPSKGLEGKSHNLHVRTQIVSPALCDDAIKYVGPLLESCKGCDILDIHPGACLWSQKLHDFLQPRSHVLLEPGYEIFKRFIDPLLTAPGSKYTLAEGDPCEMQTYKTMVNEGAFPHQIPQDPQGPRAQELNNTLLVTGSLVWDPKLPGLSFDSMAKQLFQLFAAAAPFNHIFHAFGLVRTLLWVQHDDFGPTIAESIAGMQKANRVFEMVTNFNVIVQAGRTNRKVGRASHGREPQYEIESTVNAMKRGRENGRELPLHRRDHIHDFAEEIDKVSGGTGTSRSFQMQDYLHSKVLAGNSTIGLLQEAFLEHYELERQLRHEHLDIDWDQYDLSPTGKPPKWNLKNHPAKQEVSRLFKKRAGVAMILRIKEHIEATADIGEELYLLECKILETPDGLEKERLMKELEDLEEEWQVGVKNVAINYGSALFTEIDDRLAIRSPPYPRLQWDRRPFEPLIMSPSEVWPQNRLSLILCEPIPRNPSYDLSHLEWIQDFIFGLYPQPHSNIIEGLNQMQHGLSDIMKDCPALTDPKKGGRLQMHHLRLRMLTAEMIEQLVAAYRKWPFKAPGSDHNRYFRIKGSLHMKKV